MHAIFWRRHHAASPSDPITQKRSPSEETRQHQEAKEGRGEGDQEWRKERSVVRHPIALAFSPLFPSRQNGGNRGVLRGSVLPRNCKANYFRSASSVARRIR